MRLLLNLLIFAIIFAAAFGRQLKQPLNIRWTKALYILFIALTYNRFLESITWHYYINNAVNFPLESSELVMTLICLIATVITMPLIIWFTIKIVKPVICSVDSPAWKYMWVISAFTFAMMYLLWLMCTSGQPNNWFLISIIIIETAAFLIYYFTLKMVAQVDKVARLSENIVQTEQQLKQQQEYYKNLQANIDEAKRARHDLRHHLNIFNAFINTGDTQKLAKYIIDYKEALKNTGREEVWDDRL